MMIDRLQIVLPWPDSRLMPNRKNGRHWGATAEAKVRSRTDGLYQAMYALKGNQFKPGDRIPTRITFVAPNKRKRDLDNLLGAMKHALDGIAMYLEVDDSRFRPLILDDGLDKEKKGFVLVELG